MVISTKSEKKTENYEKHLLSYIFVSVQVLSVSFKTFELLVLLLYKLASVNTNASEVGDSLAPTKLVHHCSIVNE
jgi:hypothetical protein